MLRVEGGPPLAVRCIDALSDTSRAKLLSETLDVKHKFVDASTGGRDDYRVAQMLYTVVDEAERIVRAVERVVPEAARRLEIAPLSPSRIECQITAHLDGGFYKAHTDDGDEEAKLRALSYVYYYSKLPQPFHGGQLMLYPPAGGDALRLEPVCGTLILFRSSLEHEVAPVSVPSRAFEDARFTVNGWVWR